MRLLKDQARDVLAAVSQQSAVPLSEEFVSGATTSERERLAVLGELVGEVLDVAGLRDAPNSWPEEVQAWIGKNSALRGLAESVHDQFLNGPALAQQIYSDAVASRSRRRLGTFFTPTHVVDTCLDLAGSLERESPQAVLDPGAGIGAFAIAAANRWRHARVDAVDINVVTLGLLGAVAAVQGLGPDRIALRRTDFLDFGELAGADREGRRLIFGNPPYTRHQEMSSKDKDRAQEMLGAMVPSRLAGLSAYFLAKTLELLHPEDSAVLLLPANWLQCNYGLRLRDELWRQARRRVELHSFPSETQIFPDARIGAVLLGIGPVRTRRMPMRFVDLGSDRDLKIEDRASPGPSDWGPTGRSINGAKRTAPRIDSIVVRRGVATGANNFFLINDRTAARLPGKVLRAVVPRLRSSDVLTVDHEVLHAAGKAGNPRWIFCATQDDLADPRVEKYVKSGEADNVHLGVLTSRRECWFDLTREAKPAPVVIGPMSKDRFRVVENAARAVHTNTYYGIDPGPEFSVVDLVGWLRSEDGQRELRAIARQLGGGLMKLEPRSLARLFMTPS